MSDRVTLLQPADRAIRSDHTSSEVVMAAKKKATKKKATKKAAPKKKATKKAAKKK